MSPKGVYPHTHIKPREYPAHIVAQVKHMYSELGMTVLEVQAALPHGYKAQRIIERHIPVRRKAAKRNQAGDANHMWKGNDAGYEAAHWRVIQLHGAARTHLCNDCGTPARDWSYDGLDPDEYQSPDNGCWYSLNPQHYQPRCVKCHRAYDKNMRLKRAEGGDANDQQQAPTR